MNSATDSTADASAQASSLAPLLLPLPSPPSTYGLDRVIKNIIFRQDEEPQLIDFGNAKFFSPSEILDNEHKCLFPIFSLPSNFVSFENKYLGPLLATYALNGLTRKATRGLFDLYLESKQKHMAELAKFYRKSLFNPSLELLAALILKPGTGEALNKAIELEDAVSQMLSKPTEAVRLLEALKLQFHYAQTIAYRYERYGKNPVAALPWYIQSRKDLAFLKVAIAYYANQTNALVSDENDTTNSKALASRYLIGKTVWADFFERHYDIWFESLVQALDTEHTDSHRQRTSPPSSFTKPITADNVMQIILSNHFGPNGKVPMKAWDGGDFTPANYTIQHPHSLVDVLVDRQQIPEDLAAMLNSLYITYENRRWTEYIDAGKIRQWLAMVGNPPVRYELREARTAKRPA